MKSGNLISIAGYVLTIIILLIPETRSLISALPIGGRVVIILLFLVLPSSPLIYDRFLRSRKIEENYPFDPFHYYPEEVKNCVHGDLPYIEMFRSAEGMKEENVESIVIPEKFNLPPQFRWDWDKIKSHFEREGRVIGSQTTARLYDIKEEQKKKKLELYFQKAEYWQAHVTNFNLDWRGWGQNQRGKVAPGPKLKPLSESLGANHLGLNCILITEDGKIILQKRSTKVAVDPGSIGLSAGGAMKWDYATKQGLPSPFLGMLMEIHDELNIGQDNISDIRLLAICRELQWGGKPTAFFIVKTKLDLKEVGRLFKEKPPTHWETEKLIVVDQNDILRIEKYMKQKDVALPTKACLHYYVKYAGLKQLSEVNLLIPKSLTIRRNIYVQDDHYLTWYIKKYLKAD